MKHYELTLTLPLKKLTYSSINKKDALEMLCAWERKLGPLHAVITETENDEETEDVY